MPSCHQSIIILNLMPVVTERGRMCHYSHVLYRVSHFQWSLQFNRKLLWFWKKKLTNIFWLDSLTKRPIFFVILLIPSNSRWLPKMGHPVCIMCMLKIIVLAPCSLKQARYGNSTCKVVRKKILLSYLMWNIQWGLSISSFWFPRTPCMISKCENHS